MASAPKIAPSILASDFLKLGDEIRAAEAGGIDRLHVDIMDGLFVPNLSLGLPIVEAVRRAATVPVEVHLMIDRPERYLADFARAGSDWIIVHQEASLQLHRTVHAVRELERKVSVGLNPGTPVHLLEALIDDLDGVLVMTVDPGFGGQRFIESTLRKVRQARELIDARGLQCEVEVDGGIDAATGPRAVEAGATILVAGTSVFRHPEGAAGGVRHLHRCCAAARYVAGGR